MKTPIKILIADDDQDTRINLRLYFESNGYACIEATDGAETIEQAKSEHPDIVLLDVMMPKLNGYQVCKALKEDPSTGKLPILILSAKAQDTDIDWGKRMGADGYITRPFEFDDIENQIKRILKKSGK